jgi:hypothetical protein
MPLIDQTKIQDHNARQREQLAKAIAITTTDTFTLDPIEFAMVHGLPICAVKEAMRRAGGSATIPADLPPVVDAPPPPSGRKVRIQGSTLWPERIGQIGEVCPVPVGAGVSMIKVVFDDGDCAYFRDDEIGEK